MSTSNSEHNSFLYKKKFKKGEHSCMQMYRAVTQTERGNLLVYEKKQVVEHN